MQSENITIVASRFNDDRALVEKIETTTGFILCGQLMPTNLTSVAYPADARNNYLYKCAECPQFVRKDNGSDRYCSASKTCCAKYYLVFKSPRKSLRKLDQSCCTGYSKACADDSTWWAVDGHLPADAFIPEQSLLPLQVEKSSLVAERLVNYCPACVNLNRQFSGAAQWRSCATCSASSPVETDLVRDSLVRVGINGEKYWQYKPRSKTEADRAHGIFGQSVFRGMGPRSYLPDYHRRSTPVRGGLVPANMAPRAVSAVGAPRLCDQSICRLK